MFKRRRFPVEIVLLCVRWYCKYGIGYWDLVEMMQERGVEVDPSTIMRWVHRYAPELEKRVRAYQGYGSTSWRVDETYDKVGGSWKYLFRAVDKHGRLIDFTLMERRNIRAAHRFQSKATATMRDWPPTSITTEKLPSYPEAIDRRTALWTAWENLHDTPPAGHSTWWISHAQPHLGFLMDADIGPFVACSDPEVGHTDECGALPLKPRPCKLACKLTDK